MSGPGVEQHGAPGEPVCLPPFLFSKGRLQGHLQGRDGVSDFASRCRGERRPWVPGALAGAKGSVAPWMLAWLVLREGTGVLSPASFLDLATHKP